MQKNKKISQDFFGIFIFGHFFCPFLKKVKYSWKKKIIKKLKKICDHKNSYAKDVKKYFNNLLAYFFLINLFFIGKYFGTFLTII